MYEKDGITYHVNLNDIQIYESFIISKYNQKELKSIRDDIKKELDGIFTRAEMSAALKEELLEAEYTDIPVVLLEDYTKYTKDINFKKGASGIVHNWRYFKYIGSSWYYAYVFVEINGEAYPVNINKLKIKDDKFKIAQRNYFYQFKNLVTMPDKKIMLLKDLFDEKEIFEEISCTALIKEILSILDIEKENLDVIKIRRTTGYLG